MAPKINNANAAAVGAVIAVPVVFFAQILVGAPSGDGGFAFWGGVGLAGAAAGIVVAAILNMRR